MCNCGECIYKKLNYSPDEEPCCYCVRLAKDYYENND